MALLMASLLVRTSNVAAVAFVGLGLVFLTAAAVRSWQVPVVTMDDHAVVLRTFIRTRQIMWSDVRDVGVTRGSSAALLPWRVPYFEKTDGVVVTADDLRSLREPSVVDEVVTDARRRLGRP